MIILSIASATILTPATTSQSGCDQYVGQNVTTQTIEQVMAPFLALGAKGEFETTDQYNARLEGAVKRLPSNLIVKAAPEDRDRGVYDADRKQLPIHSYSLHNYNLSDSILFGSDGPYAGVLSWIDSQNIQVQLSEKWTRLRTYGAQNRYGWSTSVSVVDVHTMGLYQGSAKLDEEDLFPDVDKETNFVGTISISPTEARRVKQTFMVGWVIAPQAPYFLTAVGKRSYATMHSPLEKKTRLSVITGDIQCALILDGQKALAAFPTR